MKTPRFVAMVALVILGCTAERGERGEIGPAGQAGPSGATGPAGEGVTVTSLAPGDPNCPHGGTQFSNSTGSSYVCSGEPVNGRMFGTGTASVTISSNTVWAVSPPANAPELRFADLTIAAGATLVVSSGTVIRCSGTFTNNGTIDVGGFAGSEFAPGNLDVGAGVQRSAPAHPGISRRAASHGMYGPSTSSQFTAFPPEGASAHEARAMIHLTAVGGGGGGRGHEYLGGTGGGTLTVLAKGPIVLGPGAEIRANGGGLANAYGAGGGGGGIVLLASGTAINNGGAIKALGGRGGSSFTTQAAGGGGGGGIVHLIAPEVVQGTVDVSGGAAGAQTTAVTASNRGAGATGGGSGGSGGDGASVYSGGGQGTAIAGAAGHSLVTNVHPAELW